MFLLSTLYFFSQEIIQLNSIQASIHYKNPVRVSTQGYFSLTTRTKFIVWDRTGEITFSFFPESESIGAAKVFPEYIIVSCWSEASQDRTYIFDFEGNKLADGDFYASNFHLIKSQLFGLPNVPQTYRGRRYPSAFVRLMIGDKIRFEPSGIISMTEKQVEMKYNFKENWIIEVPGGTAVVNELENKIFFVPGELLNQEKQHIFNFPTRDRFVNLPLKGFQQLEEIFQPPRGVHLYDKIEKMHHQWAHSFSRIVGFHIYKEGYLLVYTVPVCDDGECFASELAFQKLSETFELADEPMRIHDGYFMGVWQDIIHVFYPNQDQDADETIIRPTVRLIEWPD